MTFTIYQCADIRTTHITARDGALLETAEFPGLVADFETGALVAVFVNEDLFERQIEELKSAGFSEAFLNIMKELHKQGIPYVRFDGDGEEVEGAPVHDW